MGDPRNLHEAVEDFFEHAIAECRPHPELSALSSLLAIRRAAIHQPMRVAFVGKTNAGKSTMMNAFLGRELAPSGNGELTFNVTWFRYGDRHELLVHLIDGSVLEESFEDLAQLATRCQERSELREHIRYIEARCPHPLLKTFDLIDTPGLHSFYQNDSKNTKRLLNDPETRPHAVVYLYTGTLQESDVSELEQFHQHCGSLMSGLTAIGALTKVDEWPDAIRDGWRSIRQLHERHPQMRRYLYTILPVVGPAALGAQTATNEDYALLHQISKLPVERIQKLTRDAEVFCEREYPSEPEVPATAERKRLFERFGRFGIRLAIEHLKSREPNAGLQLDLEAVLPSIWMQSSNVDQLRKVVQSHFGNRSYLIKVRSAFASIRDLAFRLSEHIDAVPSSVAGRIAGRVDSILARELRFLEFELLERYYRGTLALTDEDAKQLLQVTGETGTTCAERLGEEIGTSVAILIRLAAQRERNWRSRSHDPFAGLEIQSVARILAESYGEIADRAAKAGEHLRAAEELLNYE